MTDVPVRFVVLVEQLFGEGEEDTALLRSMAADAEKYLSSFHWCSSIKRRYFGAGIGKVVAVFLFQIVPGCAGADEWLWVVVGDLPPAYLVTDASQTPSQALEGYIEEMRRWCSAAAEGRASKGVIPVNVPATPEWSKELSSRLHFLE